MDYTITNHSENLERTELYRVWLFTSYYTLLVSTNVFSLQFIQLLFDSERGALRYIQRLDRQTYAYTHTCIREQIKMDSNC